MDYFYKKSTELKVKFKNKTVNLTQVVKAFYEDQPFDGDNEDDIEAFKRGEFTMIGVTVEVLGLGLEGTDHLGMCCYKTDADIADTITQHCMDKNALNDWKDQVNEILKTFGGTK